MLFSHDLLVDGLIMYPVQVQVDDVYVHKQVDDVHLGSSISDP